MGTFGYLTVWGLIILITILQISIFSFGATPFPTRFIMLLALVQALLIGLFYMDLIKEPRSVWGLMAIGTAVVLVLFTGLSVS